MLKPTLIALALALWPALTGMIIRIHTVARRSSTHLAKKKETDAESVVKLYTALQTQSWEKKSASIRNISKLTRSSLEKLQVRWVAEVSKQIGYCPDGLIIFCLRGTRAML